MITDNTISYCGFARMKKLFKDTVLEERMFYNNGTSKLFAALCSALCRQAESLLHMPQYLEVSYTDTEGNKKNILTQRVPLTNLIIRDISMKDDQNNITHVEVGAMFTAFIPGTLVLGAENPVTSISLHSELATEDSTLAEITVEDDNVKLNNSSSYSYIIEWVLTFTNKVTTTN